MKGRIQIALIANAQRRAAEQLRNVAETDLANALSKAPTVYAQEAEDWANAIPWPQANLGSHRPSNLPTHNAKYHDTDNWNLARVTLLYTSMETDCPGFVFFGHDLPVWRISCCRYAELRASIVALIDTRFRQFAWISEDFDHGVLLSDYIGYVPKNRRTNLDETVYEVLTWGDFTVDEPDDARESPS